MGDHAITLLKEPGTGADGTTPTFDELFSEHNEKVLLAGDHRRTTTCLGLYLRDVWTLRPDGDGLYSPAETTRSEIY